MISFEYVYPRGNKTINDLKAIWDELKGKGVPIVKLEINPEEEDTIIATTNEELNQEQKAVPDELLSP